MGKATVFILLFPACALQAGNAPCIYDACEEIKVSARCGVRSKAVCETEGIHGGGFHVDGRDYLLIPFAPRPGARPYGIEWRAFTGRKGSVVFYFKPSDAGYMSSEGVLCAISAGWQEEPRFSCILLTMTRQGVQWKIRSALIDADGSAVYGGESDLQWRSDTWHRLGLHWDIERNYVVHTVDGSGPAHPAVPPAFRGSLRIPVLGPDISVGGAYGSKVIPGTYDEIRVYDAPAIPPVDRYALAERTKGLFAAKMLHDCLEDSRWSNYCHGAVEKGEYVPAFLTGGFRLGTGGSATYRLMQPDDGSRGSFQTMSLNKGTLSIQMKPTGNRPGRILATPLFSLSMDSGNRVQVQAGQTTAAGPVLPTGEFSHFGLSYDTRYGRLELFHNGRPFGEHHLTRWSIMGAFQVVLGGKDAADVIVDEVSIYDGRRQTFPEAAGVLFYSSFDRPGCFADYARGRIEALGRPATGEGRWGKGFVSHKYSLLRYPYHEFFRLEQKETPAVNAFHAKGTISFWFKPETSALQGFRRPLVYLRGHGMGRDSWEVNLDNGRPAVRGMRSFRAAVEKAIPSNEWRHFCLTYDDERTALYIDGEPVLRERLPSKAATNANEALPFSAWWAVGSAETGQWNTEGVFDELLLFGRVLYEEEVKALHQYYQTAESGPGPLFPWETLLN